MSEPTREQIEQSLYELQRELAVAKVDADHFFQLSGQYLERANKAEDDLSTIKEICKKLEFRLEKEKERAAQAESKNIALTKAIENLKECLDQAEAEREALRVVK